MRAHRVPLFAVRSQICYAGPARFQSQNKQGCTAVANLPTLILRHCTIFHRSILPLSICSFCSMVFLFACACLITKYGSHHASLAPRSPVLLLVHSRSMFNHITNSHLYPSTRVSCSIRGSSHLNTTKKKACKRTNATHTTVCLRINLLPQKRQWSNLNKRTRYTSGA